MSISLKEQIRQLNEGVHYHAPFLNVLIKGREDAATRKKATQMFYDFYAMELMHRLLGSPRSDPDIGKTDPDKLTPQQSNKLKAAVQGGGNNAAGAMFVPNWGDVEDLPTGISPVPSALRKVIDDVYEEVVNQLTQKMMAHLRLTLVQEFRYIVSKASDWQNFRHKLVSIYNKNGGKISKEEFSKAISEKIPGFANHEDAVRRLLKFCKYYKAMSPDPADAIQVAPEPPSVGNPVSDEPETKPEVEPEEEPTIQKPEEPDDTDYSAPEVEVPPGADWGSDDWKGYSDELEKAKLKQWFKNKKRIDEDDESSYAAGRISPTTVLHVRQAINKSGLTWGDILLAYKNLNWGGAYGGPKWGEGVESFIKLMPQAKNMNTEDMAGIVDHIYDLEHNTGALLNKGGMYVAPEDLDRRAKVTSLARYLPNVSPLIQRLILRVLGYTSKHPDIEKDIRKVTQSPVQPFTPEQKEKLSKSKFEKSSAGEEWTTQAPYENKKEQTVQNQYTAKYHTNGMFSIEDTMDADVQVFETWPEFVEWLDRNSNGFIKPQIGKSHYEPLKVMSEKDQYLASHVKIKLDAAKETQLLDQCKMAWRPSNHYYKAYLPGDDRFQFFAFNDGSFMGCIKSTKNIGGVFTNWNDALTYCKSQTANALPNQDYEEGKAWIGKAINASAPDVTPSQMSPSIGSPPTTEYTLSPIEANTLNILVNKIGGGNVKFGGVASNGMILLSTLITVGSKLMPLNVLSIGKKAVSPTGKKYLVKHHLVGYTTEEWHFANWNQTYSFINDNFGALTQVSNAVKDTVSTYSSTPAIFASPSQAPLPAPSPSQASYKAHLGINKPPSHTIRLTEEDENEIKALGFEPKMVGSDVWYIHKTIGDTVKFFPNNIAKILFVKTNNNIVITKKIDEALAWLKANYSGAIQSPIVAPPPQTSEKGSKAGAMYEKILLDKGFEWNPSLASYINKNNSDSITIAPFPKSVFIDSETDEQKNFNSLPQLAVFIKSYDGLKKKVTPTNPDPTVTGSSPQPSIESVEDALATAGYKMSDLTPPEIGKGKKYSDKDGIVIDIYYNGKSAVYGGNEHKFFYDFKSLIDYLENKSSDSPSPFANELTPDEISSIDDLLLFSHLASKIKTIEMGYDKAKVTTFDIIDEGEEILVNVHKYAGTYRIYKQIGNTWDLKFSTPIFSEFMDKLKTYLGSSDKTSYHKSITPDEYNKIRGVVSSFGGDYYAQYGYEDYGKASNVEIFSHGILFLTAGKYGSYYQLNDNENEPVLTVPTFDKLISSIESKLKEVGGTQALISKESINEIHDIAAKEGFEYHVQKGDSGHNEYIYLKGKEEIDVVYYGSITYNNPGVFGPVQWKSAKDFISWFKNTYPKVPKTGKEFSDNMFEVLKSGAFVNPNKVEVIPHQKINAIKALRKYIMDITGGPSSLAKTKWAVENLPVFLDLVSMHGLPNMDANSNHILDQFKDVPKPDVQGDKLSAEEQFVIGQMINEYNSISYQIITDTLLIHLKNGIISYKIDKSEGLYKVFVDHDGKWDGQAQVPNFEKLKEYLQYLFDSISKALANSKLETPLVKTEPSALFPDMLSSSEVTELKKLAAKLNSATSVSYNKKIMEEKEYKEEKLAHSVTIVNFNHKIYVKIYKENGLYVFAKDEGVIYKPIKRLGLFNRMLVYIDYFLNINTENQEQSVIEKLSDIEYQRIKSLVKQTNPSFKVRRKYMVNNKMKVPYVFIGSSSVTSGSDYSIGKTTNGDYKLFSVDNAYGWKSIATNGFNEICEILEKALKGYDVSGEMNNPSVLNQDQLEWIETLMKTHKPSVEIKQWPNGTVGGYDSANSISGHGNPLFVIRFSPGSKGIRILQVHTEDGGGAYEEYIFSTFNELSTFIVHNLDTITQLLKGGVTPEGKLESVLTKSGFEFKKEANIMGVEDLGEKHANIYENNLGEILYLFDDGSSRLLVKEDDTSGNNLKKEFTDISGLVDWMENHYGKLSKSSTVDDKKFAKSYYNDLGDSQMAYTIRLTKEDDDAMKKLGWVFMSSGETQQPSAYFNKQGYRILFYNKSLKSIKDKPTATIFQPGGGFKVSTIFEFALFPTPSPVVKHLKNYPNIVPGASVNEENKLFEKIIESAAAEYGENLSDKEINTKLEDRGFDWSPDERFWINEELKQVIVASPTSDQNTGYRIWWIKNKKIETSFVSSDKDLLSFIDSISNHTPSGETYKTHNNEANAALIWLNDHDTKLLKDAGFLSVPHENHYYKNADGDIIKFTDTGTAEYINIKGSDVLPFDSIPYALKFIVNKYDKSETMDKQMGVKTTSTKNIPVMFPDIDGIEQTPGINEKFISNGFKYDNALKSYIKEYEHAPSKLSIFSVVKWDGEIYHVSFPHEEDNGTIVYKPFVSLDANHVLMTIKKVENAEFGDLIQTEEEALDTEDAPFFNAPNSWLKYDPYSSLKNPNNISPEQWIDSELISYGFGWSSKDDMYWWKDAQGGIGPLWQAVRFDKNGTIVYFYHAKNGKLRYFCNTNFNEVQHKIEVVAGFSSTDKQDPELFNPKNYPTPPENPTDADMYFKTAEWIELTPTDSTAVLGGGFKYEPLEHLYKNENGDAFKVANNGMVWYQMEGTGTGWAPISHFFNMFKSKYSQPTNKPKKPLNTAAPKSPDKPSASTVPFSGYDYSGWAVGNGNKPNATITLIPEDNQTMNVMGFIINKDFNGVYYYKNTKEDFVYFFVDGHSQVNLAGKPQIVFPTVKNAMEMLWEEYQELNPPVKATSNATPPPESLNTKIFNALAKIEFFAVADDGEIVAFRKITDKYVCFARWNRKKNTITLSRIDKGFGGKENIIWTEPVDQALKGLEYSFGHSGHKKSEEKNVEESLKDLGFSAVPVAKDSNIKSFQKITPEITYNVVWDNDANSIAFASFDNKSKNLVDGWTDNTDVAILHLQHSMEPKLNKQEFIIEKMKEWGFKVFGGKIKKDQKEINFIKFDKKFQYFIIYDNSADTIHFIKSEAKIKKGHQKMIVEWTFPVKDAMVKLSDYFDTGMMPKYEKKEKVLAGTEDMPWSGANYVEQWKLESPNKTLGLNAMDQETMYKLGWGKGYMDGGVVYRLGVEQMAFYKHGNANYWSNFMMGGVTQTFPTVEDALRWLWKNNGSVQPKSEIKDEMPYSNIDYKLMFTNAPPNMSISLSSKDKHTMKKIGFVHHVNNTDPDVDIGFKIWYENSNTGERAYFFSSGRGVYWKSKDGPYYYGKDNKHFTIKSLMQFLWDKYHPYLEESTIKDLTTLITSKFLSLR